MEEALADPAFGFEPRPPLTSNAEADVVVLGGGYTGMWTAWFLTERAPGIDVVLLEHDICGGGPSGRNGGFCYGMWEDLEILTKRFGDGAALKLAEIAQRSVDEIEAWLVDRDVDAWFTRAGHLTVATSPAQDGAWDAIVDEATRLGVAEGRFVPLTPAEVQERCAGAGFRGGLLQPENATLQPARLALGLRRALLDRGVRIHEATTVRRFGAASRAGVTVEVAGGARVRARNAVLGLGAWTSSLRRFRRAVVPRGTYIVVTAPAPEKLADVGWTGGEGLADWRTALRYFRTTPDGRIAFGAGAATAGLGTGLGPRLRYDETSIARLVRDVRRFFPSFADVPIEAGWGGPMDVTGLHLPFFGSLARGAVHVGVGYTGGGVGPCHLGGKILSALALGIEDEHASLPLVGLEPLRFPPEPFRSVGAAVVQGSIVRKDETEDRGREPDLLTGFLARLPRRMGFELGP
jgi:glycine/D-amino acid oxidase-like deaminating enzyme